MTAQRELRLKRLAQFREARVADAAWHFSSQYPEHQWRRCLDLGFTEDEIREGFELGEKMAREYHINRCTHGDPSYGRWGVHSPAPAQPIRDLVLIWLQGPNCAECGETAPRVGDSCHCITQEDRERALLVCADGGRTMTAEWRDLAALLDFAREVA